MFADTVYLNNLLILTEKEILRIGSDVEHCDGFTVYRNCKMPEYPKSHVVFMEEEISKPVIADCGHKFVYVNPWYNNNCSFMESFPGSVSNWGMIKKMKNESLSLKNEKEECDKCSDIISGSKSDNYENSLSIELCPVETSEEWDVMMDMRVEIEKPFKVEAERAREFVHYQAFLQNELLGGWYVARHGNKPVGNIGLFCIQHEGEIVGRLQDVDIIPEMQGQGLGHALLKSIIHEAENMGCSWLCLSTESDDWPKELYMKHGFIKTGEWLITGIDR